MAAMILFHGATPPRYQENTQTTCQTQDCVNPAHLEFAPEQRNVGESSPRAKLSRADVADILTALERGEKVTDLARHYGVVHATISHIKSGLNWKKK